MTKHQSELELNEEAFSYPGWRVTVASGAGVFVSFGSLLVYTFGIFLKPLTEEFAWSRQAVSLAFGIAAMALAAASPPLGYLIDRFGPRRIILSCLTIFGCAFTSLALLTPHIGHLYAVFGVLGLVGNGAAHLAYSRVVSTWFDRRRGMALAVLMAGGALGSRSQRRSFHSHCLILTFIPRIHSPISFTASRSTIDVASGGIWPRSRCDIRWSSTDRSGLPGAMRRASGRP